jgi:predicted TPR repeat methyltransferase
MALHGYAGDLIGPCWRMSRSYQIYSTRSWTRAVDLNLSRAILDQAVSQRPGLYDEVIAGDVIQTFHDKASSLSLIIAADSFIYFGNLDPLLTALHMGLTNDGGLAAFTLENVNVDDEHILAATKNDWRWQLTA